MLNNQYQVSTTKTEARAFPHAETSEVAARFTVHVLLSTVRFALTKTFQMEAYHLWSLNTMLENTVDALLLLKVLLPLTAIRKATSDNHQQFWAGEENACRG